MNVEDLGGEGNGKPLLYSCLENPMDRGAWQAMVTQGSRGSDTTSVRPFAHASYLLRLHPKEPNSIFYFINLLLAVSTLFHLCVVFPFLKS